MERMHSLRQRLLLSAERIVRLRRLFSLKHLLIEGIAHLFGALKKDVKGGMATAQGLAEAG